MTFHPSKVEKDYCISFYDQVFLREEEFFEECMGIWLYTRSRCIVYTKKYLNIQKENIDFLFSLLKSTCFVDANG